MIESIAKLAFIYVLTSLFIELAFPAGKRFIKYIYWSALLLTIFITVGPYIIRIADDIHNASVTYSKVKEGAEVVTGGVDAVASWPDSKENIPIVGTGPSKYPIAITLMEKLRPSSIRFDLPTSGAITQEFKGADHHGIDYAVDEGTVVKVAREGKVVDVGFDNVYGNRVLVDHGGGWQTLYAHLSKISVKKGDRLWGNSSQVGLSGNTGKSTGPHLHMEIRVGGKAINPKPWMKEK